MIKKIPIDFLLFIGVVLLFALTRNFHPLYYSNQNEYYLHAFARTHQGLLQNDWFIQTQPKHIIFSWLIEVLYRLNIVEVGSYVIQTTLEAIFYCSVFLISQSIFLSIRQRSYDLNSYRINKLALIVVAILIVLRDSGLTIGIINHLVPDAIDLWRQFLSLGGVAEEYILSGYLQPADFGVLILISIALALRNHWRVATLLLAITVNIQFSYAVHCGLLMLIFALWLIIQRERLLVFQLFAIFGLVVLPITIHSVIFLADPLSEIANKILAVERFPHHFIPSHFWGGLFSINTLKMFMVIVSILLCLRFKLYFVATILLIGFLFIVTGLLYVHFTNNYTVAMLLPWRSSIYLIPLSIFIIISLIVWNIFLHLNIFQTYKIQFRVILLFIFIALVCAESLIFIKWNLISPQVRIPDPKQMLYDKVSQITKPTDVILIPLNPDDFNEWEEARLSMKRPIYVDQKSVPMLGTEVMEWWSRVNFVKQFYQQSLKEQLELCDDAQVNYFITEATDTTITVSPILYVKPFYLYACQ